MAGSMCFTAYINYKFNSFLIHYNWDSFHRLADTMGWNDPLRSHPETQTNKDRSASATGNIWAWRDTWLADSSLEGCFGLFLVPRHDFQSCFQPQFSSQMSDIRCVLFYHLLH